MARKKRATRRTSSTAKRKKKKTRQTESKQAQSRTLIAILALLLFLHLIDEKTFDGFTSTLKPRRKQGRAKKSRRRSQRTVKHEEKTHLSRKSGYAKRKQ